MKTLLSALLLLFSLQLQAQHLSFAAGNDPAGSGSLEVWRQCQEDACSYALHGLLSAEETPITLTLTSHFINSQLEFAAIRRHEEGTLKEAAGVRWSETGYQFVQDGSFSSISKKPVKNSLVTLFFQEPKGVRRIFLEADGMEAPLFQLGPHTYEVFRPNGERYRFLYDMGICTGVLIENEHGTFTFLLRSAQGSASELMK